VHLRLELSLLQGYRLDPNLAASVRCEVTVQPSAVAAALPPPYSPAVPCWKSTTIDDVFSPAFLENCFFDLRDHDACVRIDVYEVLPVASASSSSSSGPDSPRSASPNRSPRRAPSPSGDSQSSGSILLEHDASRHDSSASRALVSPNKQGGPFSPSRGGRRVLSKERLVSSVVIPVSKLLGTTTAHWYKLVDATADPNAVSPLHSAKVVDALVNHSHNVRQTNMQLPFGALQLRAKV
jgi:hypothetical protein